MKQRKYFDLWYNNLFIYIEANKLIAQSMNQFWSQNQRLLQKFLTQKEDQTDEVDSLTSDCEDVANNNQYSI
mgnify:CR=1 FL=1